ncbi:MULTISPECIES: leucine-rich repeat domain-containing protein [Pontibacillus]|uniref:Leucine-rich repeat domain-containing protein n=1 Tax=Pontibacillus chungwhensis TaxID=265426 RepID=A0ABY8V1Y8_9BACI|nr:leucine-rich repeat domain-containing protein [Pontibacillus chungwhensis]MCD5324438.1 leucine-rich repeat domain-containing protein [Pontibacillus sp. HN14]WIF99267.1 leucine-rich repeat domain-containing protein [Pontibacillus chungwhensis]
MLKKGSILYLVLLGIILTSCTNNEATKEAGHSQVSSIVKQELEEKLNKDFEDITKNDLKEIKSLELNASKEVAEPLDISGISELTNLENLSVNFPIKSEDKDLLSKLSNLKRLNIENVNIENTLDISNLVQLEHLDLINCSVNDLSFLQELTNLRSLLLDQNSINDLSPIRDLTELSALYLRSNNITSIEPLSNLTNLKYLNIESNHIENLRPLLDMNELESLYANNNPITDLSPLTDKSVRLLSIKGTKVSDTKTITTLKKLSSVDIRDTNITKIEKLKVLPELRLVILNKEKISDWEALTEGNEEIQVVEMANSL